MSPADFLLKYLKKLTLNTSHVWLLVSLIVWMVGIGGSDLYAIPALIGLIFLFRDIVINDRPLTYFSTSINHRLVKVLYFLLILVVLAKTLLSLYSFSWHIFDVGSYSNVVFNLSNGLNYNSFLQIPATYDHFTPSLSLFVPLYWIGASVHWLTFAKALSYL